jgi:hypothetical protein
MLQHFIEEFSVTGLTSNPTIFDHAIRQSATCDEDISWKSCGFWAASRRRVSISTRSRPGCGMCGAASFVKSWNDLLARIESKSATIRKAS